MALLEGVFARKNINLITGLLALFLFLWGVMFAVPGPFVSLFETSLGNLILVAFIVLASMYKLHLGVGLGIVFAILWRFSHIRIEQFIL